SQAEGRIWCRATLWPGQATQSEMFAGDYVLATESGTVIAEGRGLRLRGVGREAMLRGLAAEHEAPLYVPEWRRQPLAGVPPAPAAEHEVWVIRSAETERARALRRAFERRGLRCIIAPGRAPVPERIGGLVRLPPEPPGEEVSPADLCREAVLDLAWLDGAGQTLPPRAWFVTRGAQAVAASPAVAPGQASLWGLGRVAALEHPELWGGLIDLDPDASPGRAAEEADDVVAAVVAADGEDQAAFRGGDRFVLRLVPHLVAHRAAVPPAPCSVVPEATYLVTGGYGAIGLHVARWLVASGARRLVLCGRSGPAAAAVDAIQELRRSGAHVRVEQADVSDGRSITQLIASIGAEAPLRGIFHAAGIVRDGVLLGRRPPAFDEVFAAKVEGSWNLHVLAQRLQEQGQPLDYFVLFSSGASLLGSMGQGSYAAANAYQDGLAHFRRARNLPATSIHWTLWSEGGMAGADVAGRMAAEGVGAITPEQGVRTLGRVLAEGLTEAAVLPVDWERYARRFGSHGPPPLLGALVGPGDAAVNGLVERLEQASPAVRHDLLLDHLRVELRHVLRLDPAHPVSPGARFFELGMDSLMAIELKNRLQARLGRSLPATLLLDCPHLEALADYLLDRLLFPVPGAREAGASILVPAVLARPGEEPEEPPAVEAMSEEQAQAALLRELADWECDVRAMEGRP
ncbi:MAG: beta-ketoacyl reductase, partial [Chloroflexota bacterium]